MITAETVNGIVRFQANGLPAVSRHGVAGPAASSCPGNSVTPAGQPGPHLAGQDSRSACKVRHACVAT